MQNSTVGAATWALIILATVAVSTESVTRSRRAVEQQSPDSQLQDNADPPIGGLASPRASVPGRTSSRLAAQRQHASESRVPAVNVPGSPFIACPINLPIGTQHSELSMYKITGQAKFDQEQQIA
jgi:hypothetical protein